MVTLGVFFHVRIKCKKVVESFIYYIMHALVKFTYVQCYLVYMAVHINNLFIVRWSP